MTIEELEETQKRLELELEKKKQERRVFERRAKSITVQQLIDALSILPPEAFVIEDERAVGEIPFYYDPTCRMLSIKYPHYNRDGDFYNLSYLVTAPEKVTP